MGKDTLHHHPGIVKFIEEVKKEIPPEIRELIGGDMPSINRLERELQEIEKELE
jgi:metal-dependent hydrolase (beta-lactamase superfamily II)